MLNTKIMMMPSGNSSTGWKSNTCPNGFTRPWIISHRRSLRRRLWASRFLSYEQPEKCPVFQPQDTSFMTWLVETHGGMDTYRRSVEEMRHGSSVQDAL
jgi:hypothetical protein